MSQQTDPYNDGLLATTEGLLLARRGDGEASERRFEDALALGSPDGFSEGFIDMWLTRSTARELLGDSGGALDAARQAAVAADHKGLVPLVRAAHARVAECEALVARG
jgi:hypothetical protein